MRTVNLFKFIGICIAATGYLQPTNNDCADAIQLCPGIVYSGSTTGATPSGDDNDICYTPENTIWYKFTTNDLGGGVTISFSNLVFNPDPSFGQILNANFFESSGECGDTPYIPMSDCGSSGFDFAISEIIVLDPNTTYYLQVSGSSDGASDPSECDFELTISGTGVEVLPPTVTINTANTTICQGSDAFIDITTTNCDEPSNYEWLLNGETIFTGPDNAFSTADLATDGGLQLILSCGNECPLSDTSDIIDITIIPVSAEAGDDELIGEGETATLNGSGIGIPTWSPGSTLTTTTEFSTVASPNQTTTYFLTMENMGCFATDSVTIYVGDIITIFTAFTPNGDNINDRWHILNSDKFPNMEVYIYDRSGQLVFSAVNYSTEDQWWDGTFKGNDLPTSAYYYVIRLNDSENTEYKGYVNLLR